MTAAGGSCCSGESGFSFSGISFTALTHKSIGTIRPESTVGFYQAGDTITHYLWGEGGGPHRRQFSLQ